MVSNISVLYAFVRVVLNIKLYLLQDIVRRGKLDCASIKNLRHAEGYFYFVVIYFWQMEKR